MSERFQRMSNSSAGLKYKLSKKLKLSTIGGPKSLKKDDKLMGKMKYGGRGKEEDHKGKCNKQEKFERGRSKFHDVGVPGYSGKGEGRSVEEKYRTAAAAGLKHSSIKQRKSKDFELFNGNPLSARGRKSDKEKSVKDRESWKLSDTVEGKARNRTRSKAIAVDRKDSSERFEGAGEDFSKVKHAKTKLSTSKLAEKRRRESDGMSRHKKGSDDDSVVTEELPKKRKRVIRIDPHDISNKRIDDSIPSNG